MTRQETGSYRQEELNLDPTMGGEIKILKTYHEKRSGLLHKKSPYVRQFFSASPPLIE